MIGDHCWALHLEHLKYLFKKNKCNICTYLLRYIVIIVCLINSFLYLTYLKSAHPSDS
jgi:uncharacterized membrane protein YwzB